MRLLFKQRFFSWLDSYDVYDEAGETIFTVEGKLSFGHCLHILNAAGVHIGTVQQKVLTLLPQFDLYLGQQHVGCIRKELTFFKPKFDLDCNGWEIDGDWMEWDYTIFNGAGGVAARVSKELWNLTDTYVVDVSDPMDALCALMVVLAIDAEKCSRND